MKERYIVFCKPTCPYCVKAVELLEEKEKVYKIVNFEENQQYILQEMKEALEWPTVPMVFARHGNDIKFIGGFSDLESNLEAEDV